MNKLLDARGRKIIISGGGTAGHIYPALAVADMLREAGAEILFVGALGRMEMERVPLNGYPIVGLPVAGIQRRLTLKNLLVPFKLLQSMRQARRIITDFKPDVVVGFGGYASAPILKAAQNASIPTVIQEQNSFAGLTNRMLAKKAKRICVAYQEMDRFFNQSKIVLTGNPLRNTFSELESKREQAMQHFALDPSRRTILFVGGSLGTRTLNEVVIAAIDIIAKNTDTQVIWQIGRYYLDQIEAALQGRTLSNIWHGAFIERMDYAYAAADVVVSRAGASTVSELELLGKATIFVPSPNVAEDHQTKNALSLVEQDAAWMVKDSDAHQQLFDTALKLVHDSDLCGAMSTKISSMGRPNAAFDVAAEVLACCD